MDPRRARQWVVHGLALAAAAAPLAGWQLAGAHLAPESSAPCVERHSAWTPPDGEAIGRIIAMHREQERADLTTLQAPRDTARAFCEAVGGDGPSAPAGF